MVQYPPNLTATSARTVDALDDLQKTLTSVASLRGIWSAALFRNSIEDSSRLEQMFNEMPPHVSKRIIHEAEHLHLMTLFLPNLDSVSIMRVVNDIRSELPAVEGRHQDFEFTITGLSLVSAEHATKTVPALHLSMWMAMVIVLVFIGIFFRSFESACFAVIPNALPIVAIGAGLNISGLGLSYASVVALTIAFGVGVDDTIHFLARYRAQREAGQSAEIAVQRTIRFIGPIVITTSVVLALGLSVTALAQMPYTRTFGVLCCLTLVVALLAD